MPDTTNIAPATTSLLIFSRSLRKNALKMTMKRGSVFIKGTTTETCPILNAVKDVLGVAKWLYSFLK